MKKLIKSKGIFSCTFKQQSRSKIINNKNECVNEWKQNRIVYLKTDGIIIAAITSDGKLILYPTWNISKGNLIRICKFTGISTKEIKVMIMQKHPDITVENNMKLIN